MSRRRARVKGLAADLGVWWSIFSPYKPIPTPTPNPNLACLVVDLLPARRGGDDVE